MKINTSRNNNLVFFSLLVVGFCTQVRYTGINKPSCSSSICPPTKISQSYKPIESKPLKMCLSPSALMSFTSISVFLGLFWARCKGGLFVVLYLLQLGARAEKLKDRKLRSQTGGVQLLVFRFLWFKIFPEYWRDPLTDRSTQLSALAYCHLLTFM